ncbi:MAG: Arc family DNA-binding protein [Spirochaetes bacterium]|jgi:plasmid stability protein|nr:Arc family DNA-binding protein [Spirochaetota bacterium]
MPAITVKNIPPGLYEKLRKSARDHRRSINSEIIICIETVLESGAMKADDILRGAALIRERTSHYHLKENELNTAKKKGRK